MILLDSARVLHISECRGEQTPQPKLVSCSTLLLTLRLFHETKYKYISCEIHREMNFKMFGLQAP